MTNNGTPDLQQLADTYRAKGTGDPARKHAKRALMFAARMPLALGEVREVTIGHVTARMYEHREVPSAYVTEVEQFGEILNGLSGSWCDEHDASRQFLSAVMLLVR